MCTLISELAVIHSSTSSFLLNYLTNRLTRLMRKKYLARWRNSRAGLIDVGGRSRTSKRYNSISEGRLLDVLVGYDSIARTSLELKTACALLQFPYSEQSVHWRVRSSFYETLNNPIYWKVPKHCASKNLLKVYRLMLNRSFNSEK